MLIKNNTLKAIDLGSSKIQDRGFGWLAKGLKMNKSIECLIVENNFLHDESGQKLLEALRVNGYLKKLKIKMNTINYEIINDIHKQLNKNIELHFKNEYQDLSNAREELEKNILQNKDLDKEVMKLLSEKKKQKKKLAKNFTELFELKKKEFTYDDLIAELERIRKIDEEISEVDKEINQEKAAHTKKEDKLNFRIELAEKNYEEYLKYFEEVREGFNKAFKNLKFDIGEVETFLGHCKSTL